MIGPGHGQEIRERRARKEEQERQGRENEDELFIRRFKRPPNERPDLINDDRWDTTRAMTAPTIMYAENASAGEVKIKWPAGAINLGMSLPMKL